MNLTEKQLLQLMTKAWMAGALNRATFGEISAEACEDDCAEILNGGKTECEHNNVTFATNKDGKLIEVCFLLR